MKFSVLISVFNRDDPLYFDRALRSIWDDQVLKPSQIVLVIDGEVTGALNASIQKWVGGLGDVLTVVFLKENLGLGGALNKGLAHCSHNLVARMDADDICLPQRFSRQVSLFEEDPSLDVVGAFAIEINEKGDKAGVRSMPVDHNDIFNSLWASPLIHPSIMYKRDRILAVGAYNSALRRRQDYELWFRCASAGFKFHNISTPLLLYRFTQKTHKKQPVGLSFEQAVIGYKGARAVNMPIWKRLACFIPFVRSLLPYWLQHYMYLALRRFDPRKAKLEFKK